LKASRDYWKQKAREAAALGTEPEQMEAGPIKSPVSGVAGGRRRLCVAEASSQ
jgi:hypothetical protein